MGEMTVFQEQWGAISQGDLGLQAAYWTGQDDDPVSFRPIVGWITWTLREDPGPDDPRPRNGLTALVIADFWYPVLAPALPNFFAYVPRGLSEKDVLPQLRAWRAKSQPEQQPMINVPGIGKA